MDFFFLESGKSGVEFGLKLVKEAENLLSDGVTFSLLFGVGGGS